MTTRQKYIKLLDQYWSTIVHLRYKGIDQYHLHLIGVTRPGYESHHIFSRKNLSTRWDTDNGILLSRGHNYGPAHTNPEAFRIFLKDKWFKSEKKYCDLYLKSQMKVQYRERDWPLLEQALILELIVLITKNGYNINFSPGLSYTAKLKALKSMSREVTGR